ncbi:MAG: peptidoglycan DD-metalloendopeptidase family protein [Saprospiraceae bacterium]|nr:peptidoglycan DD-metalloendopeptidase family protein [Saprospiraceae bacterium]
MKNKVTKQQVEVISKSLVSNFLKPQNIVRLTAITAISASTLFFTEATNLTSFVTKRGLNAPRLSALPVVSPNVKYGFALDTFNVIEDKVKHDDIFTIMLAKRGLTAKQADSLARQAKAYYDFEKIQDGTPYTVLSRDPRTGYDYLIYEPDSKRFIVVDFKNVTIKEVKREVVTREFEIAGKVKNSLWETMVEQGLSYALADEVEDALKYKFDLRKFEDGDEYKLIWEEEFVEGQSIGVKTLKAVSIKDKSAEKPVYAFHFNNGKEKGWYGKDGLPMRDGFLKSPLKYSRITSHYSKNRFHPILGYNRPHYGTDYAAPHGTPILSVADGVVTEARHGGGNGNYVKIRHMKPYESQYLHMSRFAKGISPGTRVRQGEVIGYVGSTGLATGPHVCFRFWKNGSQVNHLNERLPQVSTFSSSDREKFKIISNDLTARLEKVPFLSEEDSKKLKREFLSMRGKP